MKKTQKSSKHPSGKGQIRIISGVYRGRKLPVLLSEGLRPTTDRVKETLFNWLAPYIDNSVCLDCFAGSGSLGFEALSRGAKSVTLIEFDQLVAKQLRANKKLLNAKNLDVIQGDTLNIMQQDMQQDNVQYSLVFIDPPFRKGLLSQVANLLVEKNHLTDNAIIYIETEAENQSPQLPSQWHLLKEKVAGQVSFQLYRHKQKNTVDQITS